MDSFRKLLHAKIHGATITHANIKYEGSITVPPSLLSAANIVPHEAVWVWDVTNGARFETYTILGEENGEIAVNGAAARLVQTGDKVIIAAFTFISGDGVTEHTPTIVFVDEKNCIREKRSEIAGPKLSPFSSVTE